MRIRIATPQIVEKVKNKIVSGHEFCKLSSSCKCKISCWTLGVKIQGWVKQGQTATLQQIFAKCWLWSVRFFCVWQCDADIYGKLVISLFWAFKNKLQLLFQATLCLNIVQCKRKFYALKPTDKKRLPSLLLSLSKFLLTTQSLKLLIMLVGSLIPKSLCSKTI